MNTHASPARLAYRSRSLSVAAKLVCLLVCAMSLLASRTAQAQALGVGEVSTPGVTRPHVDRAIALFQPTDEQLELIEIAYDLYLDRVRDTADTMREVQRAAFDEYRDTGNPEIWRDLIPVVDRYEARRDELDADFLEEVRLVLDDAQRERWSRFQRDRRRMIGLTDGGLVSGDSVDLVDVVERTRLSEDARAAALPVLDRYIAEMDRLMIEIAEARDELDKQALDAFADFDFSAQEPDFTAFNELLNGATQLSAQIRDVNQRYASLLARTIGGEEGDRIERAYLSAAYPAVFRTSSAERTLDAALSFDDLTDEQRESIETLRDRYFREVERSNEAWVDAIQEAESGGTIEDLFAGVGFGDEAERQARRDRRDLDRRYADTVRNLLNDEQSARLPQPARLESERRSMNRSRSSGPLATDRRAA